MILSYFMQSANFTHVFYALFLSVLGQTVLKAFDKDVWAKKLLLLSVFLIALVTNSFFVFVSMIFIYVFSFLEEKKEANSLWGVLITCVALGGILSVNAKNFLSMFIGLELQNLALALIAAKNYKEDYGLEPGIKFFIGNVCSTFIMLFGISILYYSTGSIEIDALSYLKSDFFSIIGVVSIFASLLFKLSLFPFSEWFLDVSKGLNPIGLASLNIIPKMSAFLIFVNLAAFLKGFCWFSDFLVLIPILSMIASSLLIIGQSNLDKLIAYSSVYNASLIVLIVNLVEKSVVLEYVYIYLISSFIFFISRVFSNSQINFLNFKSKASKYLMFFSILTLASLPPFPMFFIKLKIIKSIIGNNLISSIVILITSSLNLFAYIRLAKEVKVTKIS